MSRKRHKLIGRPMAGQRLRSKRYIENHGLRLSFDAIRKAWGDPPRPWKDKRKGWMTLRKPDLTGEIQMELVLEYGLPSNTQGTWTKIDAD